MGTVRGRCIAQYSSSTARILYSRLYSTDHWYRRGRDGAHGHMEAWMGPSGFPVIIESQAIMVSTWVAIGKLNHALEVWSDGPRLPNIEPLQHEPSTADSTAIQRCIGQYISRSLCTRGVVLYCNTALYILQLYSALHSTALYNPPQLSTCPAPAYVSTHLRGADA